MWWTFSYGSGGRADCPLIGRLATRFPAPPLYMSKCPWAKYWTQNCSWWLCCRVCVCGGVSVCVCVGVCLRVCVGECWLVLYSALHGWWTRRAPYEWSPFTILSCLCGHTSVFLGMLLPPVDQSNGVKPLAGMKTLLCSVSSGQKLHREAWAC